ncbi:MAG: hypothetical protein ACOYZ6_19770 [Chloroflexota bacterium]
MSKSMLVKVLTVLFLLFVSACSNAKPATDSFQLFILKEGWWDLQLGYKPETAQLILKEADTSDSLFVIGIDEIEKYDWDLQTITLTEDATIKLIEAVMAQGETSDENLKKFKEMMANAGFGNQLELALYNLAFVVKVNNETRYGGIFLNAISQMGIDYPVIRVTIEDEKAVLAILPIHVPFTMNDPVDGNENLRKPAVAEEAQQDVQQLDFFSGWINEMAMSESANKYRALIRDDQIMNIFKHAGKLAK